MAALRGGNPPRLLVEWATSHAVLASPSGVQERNVRLCGRMVRLVWTAAGPAFKSQFSHWSIGLVSWKDTAGSPVSSLNCDLTVEWFDVSESDLTTTSTNCRTRSFRSPVFPDNHLHWYYNNNNSTGKRQMMENTKTEHNLVVNVSGQVNSQTSECWIVIIQ